MDENETENNESYDEESSLDLSNINTYVSDVQDTAQFAVLYEVLELVNRRHETLSRKDNPIHINPKVLDRLGKSKDNIDILLLIIAELSDSTIDFPVGIVRNQVVYDEKGEPKMDKCGKIVHSPIQLRPHKDIHIRKDLIDKIILIRNDGRPSYETTEVTLNKYPSARSKCIEHDIQNIQNLESKSISGKIHH
jgi:hypothetical protein